MLELVIFQSPLRHLLGGFAECESFIVDAEGSPHAQYVIR